MNRWASSASKVSSAYIVVLKGSVGVGSLLAGEPFITLAENFAISITCNNNYYWETNMIVSYHM